MVWLSEPAGTVEWKCLQKCQTSYWNSVWQSNWKLLCQTHTWLVSGWSPCRNVDVSMFEFGRHNLWIWTLQYLWYLLYWTVSVLLSQRKQFIRVNRMSYIAHTLIWLTVSFVPPHPKQLIELNRMPFIAHATKIWTVFDASVIANVLPFFDGFLHHRLRLWHRTQFRQRVSDRSVALAASYNSVMKSTP